MGILKSLLPASNGGKHPSGATRAEAFMAEHARRSVTFATEREARTWFLEQAEEKWSSCRACPLYAERRNVVYGEGDPEPELLILGEAPGEAEDLSGVPFVGESGIILRRILRSQKVGLRDVPTYVANVIACRPPKNRKPERAERDACEPRVRELLAITKPRVLLLLGASAGHWFGVREVGASRGLVPRAQWPTDLGEGARNLRAVIQTYHPSYLLHQDKKTRRAVAFAELVGDVCLARRAVEQIRRTS